MRILVFGGTGVVGRAAVAELSQRHEVVTVGRNSGDFQGDISQSDALPELFGRLGKFDALVSCIGAVHFKPLNEMGEQEWLFGIQHKLMVQVNLVQVGMDHANDGASFTLTSGLLNRDPIVSGSSAAMVNGALEGFVTAAAQELPRGMRLNVVSPGLLQGAAEAYAPWFRGFQPIPDERAGLAYARCVEGAINGQTLLIH